MRRLIRLTFALALLGLGAPALKAEEDLVLVPRAPVYHPGESADGFLFAQRSGYLLLRQRAYSWPDGYIRLLMSVIDRKGEVQLYILLDPRTWLSYSVSDDETGRTVDTTCSARGLYPITLRKVYECTNTVQIGDKLVEVHSRMEFNEVNVDEHKKIVDFCARTIEEGEYRIEYRTCFTADGKWIKYLMLLSIEKRNDA